ncbi:hypothetical protein H5A21_07110 [Pectobacterium aquaticum]|uniref:hypothetical protein n=1 Tax=Pectobacterium quasiaquaticum TaxID=2774015 RepID=UPI001874F6FC|nr:hypothetical protein [Pectobacterium quasiaquaticum]MBN3063858.1 hypothetical protein [Pectobacterium aquaticum]
MKIIKSILKRKLNHDFILIFSDDVLHYLFLVNDLATPRKIVIFRNLINKKYKKRVEGLRESGFDMYTFDPSDAQFFNIKFKDQYLPVYKEKENIPECRAYFLGLNKGRRLILSRLSEKLTEKGINSDITIIEESDFSYLFFRKNVSYRKNVNNVLKSSYIIDIVKEGQDGLTLRALESVFYQRKLITNNKKIASYDFFNPQNILILDDDMNIPDDFLKTSFIVLPENVLDKYKSDNYYIGIIEKVS